MRPAVLEPGTELPTLTKGPLERIWFVRYAGASGDFNRIHVEEGFAQGAGYKGVFAHGMLTMAFMGQLLTDWLGGPAAIRSLGCRFRAIAWPEDVLTFRGRIAKSELHGEKRMLEIVLSATNQRDELIADGKATVALAEL